MIQAQENTSKPTQTSLQRDPEKKSEHPNERAEFTDNRASIVSQRKLSNALGQKEAKVVPFTPKMAPKANNSAPTQLKPNKNAADPITQFEEAPDPEAEKEKKQDLNDIILKYQNLIGEAKSKLEEAHKSKDLAAIEEATKVYKDVKAEAKEKKSAEMTRLGGLDLDTADLAGEGIDSKIILSKELESIH